MFLSDKHAAGRIIKITGRAETMEIFVEDLVKRQNSGKTTLIKAGIAFAAIILSIVAFMACTLIKAISFFGIFIVAGIIYGAWYLIRSYNLEFEYILTNGILDVDKIIAQSKRKRLTSVDLKNIEIMAPVNPSYRREYDGEGIAKKIDASTGGERKEYFIKFSSGKDGMTVLRFNPDERILKGAHMASPRKVFEE